MEAKAESELRILRTLENNPMGVRFRLLRESTVLHQDTLTNRLADLVERRLVLHQGNVYALSVKGADYLWKIDLLSEITSFSGLSISDTGASAFADEDPILKSTIGYEMPGLIPGVVGSIKRIVHKYWMLHLLSRLAMTHKIDPRCLTGEKPLELLIPELRKNLRGRNVVLAFTIDRNTLRENLNVEYLQRILDLAEVEDKHNLETKVAAYWEAFRKYAEEA
jgi:hypothetical protein